MDRVLEQLEGLISENPEVASAALIAIAVERGLLDDRTARSWARALDLHDFERTKALLAREVDRAGHTSLVVDLLRMGRRIQQRTKALLDASAAG